MESLLRFVRKLTLLFARRRFRQDLDEEMAFHRAAVERDLAANGIAPETARFAATRQFGNATQLREQSHEVIGFSLETVVQDVRFALRQLHRMPGFALIAISILALGIGVSVAIFGFVDAALLEPLPFVAPNRLVAVDEMTSMFPRSNLSRDDYDDWKRMNTTLSSLEVYSSTGFLYRTASGVEPLPAARVSAGFFNTLGIRPLLGRTFLPGEDRPGGAKIVILSYGTWLQRFGARRDVIGRSITLNGNSYTIVGVLPREFAFAPRGSREFWVPLLDKTGCEQRRSCHNLDGIGRLRDGVTLKAASDEMKAIATQLARQYPGSNQGQSAVVEPLSELLIGQVKPILLTLMAGAGLLLLIACVNVASLLLVRSESRRREIAVRGALGATPARLVRQFVTEGLLLAAAGSVFGALAADWIMLLLRHLVPKIMAEGLPFLNNVGMNAHTIAFTATVALFAASLSAVTPILRLSFQQIRDGLAEGGRGSAGRLWQRLGANLVVVELTIAVVLLVGAGLLGKSLYRLMRVDDGFDTTHLATVQVVAPDSIYNSTDKTVALYKEIETRLKALPGVQSVGITSDLPLQCNCDTDWIRIVGKPFHGEHNEVNERDVSPAYLPTLKATLVRGRFFTEDDRESTPRVIVINEALANKYFPGEDPIGHQVGTGDLDPKSLRVIVGVVKSVREGTLDTEIWPTEYQALYQGSDTYFSVAMRTAQDEKTMLPVMVSTLRGIDPNLGLSGEITMTDQIASMQVSLLHRFSTWLVGGFAVFALLLGTIGLYGVVAYSVSQRTREIGVRMALGAQRSSVYKLVMREAGRLTVTGLAAGLVCAVGASMLMRKLLFGVQAWDIPTLAAVALVLGTASLAASFLPAARAASVSPTEALRSE